MNTFETDKKKEPPEKARSTVGDARGVTQTAAAAGGDSPLENFMAARRGADQPDAIMENWLAALDEFDHWKTNPTLFNSMELDPAWLNMKDVPLLAASAPATGTPADRDALSVPDTVFPLVRDLQMAIGYLEQSATGVWIDRLERQAGFWLAGRVRATISTVGAALAEAMTALCDSASLAGTDPGALSRQEESAGVTALAGDVLNLLGPADVIRLVDAGGGETGDLLAGDPDEKVLRARLTAVLAPQLRATVTSTPALQDNLAALTRLRVKDYYTARHGTLGESVDKLQRARAKSARLREAVSAHVNPGLDDRAFRLVKNLKTPGELSGVRRRAEMKALIAPLMRALEECEKTLGSAADRITVVRAGALNTLVRLFDEKVTDSTLVNHFRKKLTGIRRAVSKAAPYFAGPDRMVADLFQPRDPKSPLRGKMKAKKPGTLATLIDNLVQPGDPDSLLPAEKKSALSARIADRLQSGDPKPALPEDKKIPLMALMLPLEHAARQVKSLSGPLRSGAEKLERVLSREKATDVDPVRLMREGELNLALPRLKGPELAERVFGTVLEGALNRDQGAVRLDDKVQAARDSVDALTGPLITLLPHLIRQLSEEFRTRGEGLYAAFDGNKHVTALINHAGQQAALFKAALTTFQAATAAFRAETARGPKAAAALAAAAEEISLLAGQVISDVELYTSHLLGMKYGYGGHERKLVWGLKMLVLELGGDTPESARPILDRLTTLLRDPTRTFLRRKHDPENGLLTAALEQALYDHHNDISLKMKPTAAERVAQAPGMMDALHSKAISKTLSAALTGGLDLPTDPLYQLLRAKNLLKVLPVYGSFKAMKDMGKSAMPGQLPPEYEQDKMLDKQAVNMMLTATTTVVPSIVLLPVAAPLAVHAALTKPALFVKKVAGRLPTDVGIAGVSGGVRGGLTAAQKIHKVLHKRTMEDRLRSLAGGEMGEEDLEELLAELAEGPANAPKYKPRSRVKRSDDGPIIGATGSGDYTGSGPVKGQQWQEELEEHKSNIELTKELMNSSVDAKRQEAKAWVINNQIYNLSRSLLQDLFTDNVLTEQLVNAFKGGASSNSDEYLDAFEKLIHGKAGAERVKAIFETFRKSLIERIPVNDMLHFTESSKLEALRYRYPNESKENIIIALKTSSESDWPQTIMDNESLREDIRILKSATPEQQEASQARWDKYWLLGMQSHLKPKGIENTLVSERLEKANLSVVEGNKVTADTPVTLNIKANSWLIKYIEAKSQYESPEAPKKQLGLHTIQTTMGDWISGRWINTYMQKLNMLYTISEPISHHKPEILDATVGNTQLTSQQINIISEAVDEEKNKFMTMLLFANKDSRNVIRRERMREMQGSLIHGQIQIDKSKMTDAEADQVEIKIQRLLAGEKESHGTFSIKSREGRLPVRGLIWFKIEGLIHLFSRKTGRHLIISEEHLNNLDDKALSPAQNEELVSFILEHADPKQSKDMMVFVGNSLHQFRQQFNERYASSVSKYASPKFKHALWKECVDKKGGGFDNLKEDLKVKYAQHPDKNAIYTQIDNLMSSPEEFDKVLKLYRTVYPAKDYELKMTIQANKKTGTLDETMNEFLLWELTSSSREFDMNTTTESEESRRQWEETMWFAASMAAAMATGGAAATAGAALKLSTTAIWCLTIMAQAGAEGAQQWLRARTYINEEERAAAIAGIPVAVLVSLGIDVGVDRVVIPLAKKAFKGLKAGLNNVDIARAIKDISILHTEKLKLRSMTWSQHTGRSRTNQVVESIMESDRIREMLKTKSRQEIREQIERSVENFRARHASQELTFTDEVAAGFKGLTPLTNAGTVSDFGSMDTYAKVNHLQNYAMETQSGKELARELGPEGEGLVKRLSVKHLTNDFYGSPKKNHVWAPESLEMEKIDILLEAELSKLRNVRSGLAILAHADDAAPAVVQAGNSTDNMQVAMWAAGDKANNMFGPYVEIVGQNYNAQFNDFAKLQKINARLSMADSQLSTHINYDPQYLNVDTGAAGFRQWLRTVDTTKPNYAELVYQAMMLYRPFKEGNTETARMVYGIIKLQRGERFSIYPQSISTPQQVLIRFNGASQAPESNLYANKRNILSQDATGTIYEDESGLMKDYIPVNGLVGSDYDTVLKKAQKDVEFFTKIHGESNVKLYHYYVNGKQQISVWIGSYDQFTAEAMIRKNIERGAPGAFVNPVARADFEQSLDELFETLQQKGINVTKVDLKDIMYNRESKKATLVNFDNAIMVEEGNTLSAHQVQPMRNAFNELKSNIDILADRVRFEQLNNYRTFMASYQDRRVVRNRYNNMIESYVPADGDSSLATRQNRKHREFMAGINEYNQDPKGCIDKLLASKKIPKNYKSLTDIELISATQYNILDSSSLTDREIGILSKIIKDKIKKYTIKDADELHGYWLKKYSFAAKKTHKLNQFTMLTAIDRPTDGRCRPLTMAMAVAIENNREKAFSQRLKGISDNIMASKDSQQSDLILQGQNFESVLRKAHAMSFTSTEVKSVSIGTLIDTLDKATSTSYFQVNTKQHSMLAAVKIVNGKKHFLFYDPNYGLFEFSSAKDMEKSLTRTLSDTEFAGAIGAEIESGNVKYDIVKIENIDELSHQKIEGVASDVTISDLSLDNVTDRLNPQGSSVTSQVSNAAQPLEAENTSVAQGNLGVYKRDVSALEYKVFKMKRPFKAISPGDSQKEFRVVPLDEAKSASKSQALKYNVSRESVFEAKVRFTETYKKINRVIANKLSPEQKQLLVDSGVMHNLEMGEKISHLFTPSSPEAEMYLSQKKVDRRIYVLIAKDEPGKVPDPKIYGLMAAEVEPNSNGVPVFSVPEVVADPASQLMLIKKISPDIYKIIIDNVYSGQDIASSSVSGVARQMSEYAVKDFDFKSGFKVVIDAQNARTAHMAHTNKFKKGGD